MKTLVCDFDSIIYQSAFQQQKSKCLVTHIESGRDKLWDSKTDFNNWLKTQDKFSKDEFSFETQYELTGTEGFAFNSMDSKIKNIFNASGCDDFILIMEGPGNFRMQRESKFVKYKASRAAKPILFNECKQYIKKKYREHLEIAKMVESDDRTVSYSWEGYLHALAKGDKNASPYVIAYIDKDIPANGRGWMLNYGKLDQGIFWNDSIKQVREFATQCLIGDAADEVPGIEWLSDSIREKYSIKTKGVGAATADKILANCTTEQEINSRVVECYKETHPEDWRERLDDNAFYLYLLRDEDDKWNAANYFKEAWNA